ncbi:ClpX C4-type zinc finger protein [Achromobacter sp. UMC46]|uniref:ClpX C4-type zinc finger protein n=1 Tax=Achromobacter sp. UMC46 TaxID=1862319 RepID=UPI0016039EEA|nr:ClpX C4-type zinc finger protein [Achromobacter sp. UMC46]
MDENNKKSPRRKKQPAVMHCSFCDKSQNEVHKLIARENSAGKKALSICDECVEMCTEIINEQGLVEAENSPKALYEYIVRQNEIIGDARDRANKALDLLSVSMPPASQSQQ